MNDDVSHEPPHNLDAERNVLATVLQRADASLLTTLQPSDFYSEVHRRVARAVKDVSGAGKSPTHPAVIEALKRNGDASVVGPLGDMMRQAKGFRGIETDAGVVRELAQARKLSRLCSDTQARIVTGRLSPRDAGLAFEQAYNALAIDAPSARLPLGGFALLASDAIFAPLEPPRYMVDPLIRRASVSIWGGYGGSGKTWLALALLLAIATGKPYLGRFPVTAGRATLLDWESGAYETRRRLQRVARGLGCHGPIPGLDVAAFPVTYMTHADFEARIGELAAERDVIVIDSLRAASIGADENESAIRGGLDALRRVAEKTDAAFVVLAHSKKTSGNATAIDPRESLRGSSAIYDAADSVLAVSYKAGEPLRIDQVKARQGRAVDPFEVTIVDEGSDVTHVTGQDVAQDPTERPDMKLREVARRVLEVVRENPECSQRFIRENVGSRAGAVGASLELLAREGRIANLGSTKSEKWRLVA